MIKLINLLQEVIKEQKEDRCKRIADKRYDKPSAYKSGAIVQCRKGKIWKDLKEEQLDEVTDVNVIKNIFTSTPELEKIGTLEQYSDYIDSIFPDSKLQDIVYHGGTLKPEDRGKDSYTGELGGKYGIYFTADKKRASNYITSDRTKNDYISRSKLYFAKLNITNPLDKKIWSKWKFGPDWITDDHFEIIKKNNADGIIATYFFSKILKSNTQFVVFNLDQIHILGSTEDIEGFKKYVGKLNEEESLHKWFNRKGAPGKSKGWVDCNTCRKDAKTGKKTCKACGRQKGEQRSKYPSCRPTPAQCGDSGKGKSWGKTK